MIFPHRRLTAAILASLLLVGSARAEDSEPSTEPLEGFREFVIKTLKAWKVPGVGVAIVRDGKILYSDGFGVRIHGETAPVTEKTLFAIGSSTKAFTALSVALLAEDGKLDIDRPVVEFLPDFKLHDDFATRRMTPRDLLTHSSGLPRHDLMWYGSTRSRKEIFERLAGLEPTKDLRQSFQYQNLMYMVAGHLVDRLSGKTWEEFVRERIFTPLHMTTSNLSIRDSKRSADHARGHNEVKGEIEVVPFRDIDAVGPAGSINSNPADMAKWLLFQLGDGKAGEKRLVSAQRFAELKTPQLVLGQPPRGPDFLHASYAMGWIVEPYRGKLRLHHGGNIDGFSTMVSLLPRQKAGVVVLASRDKTPVPEIVSLRAIDQLLNLKPIDWNTRTGAQLMAARASMKSAAKSARSDPTRKVGTSPSHDLRAYAGDYEHESYGPIAVRLDGDKLRVSYNGLEAELEHWHYDVFLTKGKVIANTKVSFSLNVEGEISSVHMPLEPALGPIEFARKSDKNLATPAYLQRFAGKYKLGPQKLEVSIDKKDALVLDISGQPRWTLVPTKRNHFKIKELDGFSLHFEVDGDRWCSGVTFVQPNGVFKGQRDGAKTRSF